ncbi:MAG: hypothetical protein ACQKBV_05745 [Puniceicoccales bacterium]
MFGLIKKLIIGFFLLLIIGLVVLYFSIDGIIGGGVKKVFNQMGPEITGTPTHIESASVNLFAGNIGINGLFIGNPEGFAKPSAMACDEIYVDIETSTLFSDEIVVNEIRIKKPSFSFEQTLLSNNLSKLKAQIDANTKKFQKEKPATETPPAEEPAQQAQKKTLRLNKLIVADGQVDLAVLTLNKEVPLPQIEKDFDGEGVTPAEAVDYVLSVVIEKVVEEAVKLAAEYSNDPKATLQNLTGEDTAEAVEKTTEAIKGLFD